MSYRVFALKYRPQDFSQVVGQEHVTSALKNAILKKRVHHAYLFSGPRGVGKTSLARILAKALNCEKGPTVTPCGRCGSCAAITAGSSLDVIEIDGASNRGIDEIRALREAAKLSPAAARYKIYIIDEVHMLTQEAFNALLKTLEEPPPHVKFIFATTHPQKVIPTILSRCQKFEFSLLTIEKITQKLELIACQEKIDLDKAVLYSIARSAQGSIRDAESLLDQVVPIILEKGDVNAVISFLGVIDEETLNVTAKHIAEKNVVGALDCVAQLIESGKDAGIFVNSLIEQFRNMLLARISPKTLRSIKSISPASKDFITKLSGVLKPQEILEVIDLLIEAKDLSRKLNSVRIPLELAVIKFAADLKTPAKIVVSNSLPPTSRSSPEGETSNKKKQTVAPKPEVHDDSDLDDLDFSGENTRTAEIQSASKGDITLTLNEVAAKWPDVISAIKKKRMSLASYLGEATLSALEEGVLKLAFPPQCAFHKEVVEASKNLHFIEDHLSQLLAKKIGVRCIISKDIQTPREKIKTIDANRQSGAAGDRSEDEVFLNELLDTFDGRIHTDDE